MSPLKLSLVAIFIFWAGFGSCNAQNILYTNDVLRPGQALISESYKLTMLPICSLVLTDDGRPVWTLRADRGTGCYLKMESNGNLVIYNKSNSPRWSSNSAGMNGSYVCILQRDRNIVVYGPSRWAAETNTVGLPEVVIPAVDFTQTTATTEPEYPTIAMVTK